VPAPRRLTKTDPQRKVAFLPGGIELPLGPFLGIMAVGRASAAAPRPAVQKKQAGAGIIIRATYEGGWPWRRGLMKIRTTLPEGGRGKKRRVTVLVEFGKERMTIEVIVPTDPDDEEEVQELAIARARDFARRFAMNPAG
jgi:hypothetical protein